MKNVYDLTQERLKFIFDEFPLVYVSFSGGKDSGVLLELCVDYIRKHNLDRKICVFHMDYEAQYSQTIEYVDRVLHSNLDIIEPYWCCVPFKVTTCCSMYQSIWRPWDPEMEDRWVRPLPDMAYTNKDFPFYDEKDFDYDFQNKFGPWLCEQKGVDKACCLVGIRAQESFNRWRAVYSDKRVNMYKNTKWTSTYDNKVYNAYPIYDWITEDIWVANGKFKWDYNKLYDLYYQAGLSLDQQRVASPFLSEGTSTLQLYRVIDPQTWGKMIGRVNGCNFTNIYGATHAMGWKNIKKPDHFTWKEFMEFLLSTLPEETANNYRYKLSVSIDFWKNRGGSLSEEIIQKLRDRNIPIEIKENNYQTDKKSVCMDYLDDIDIPEFVDIPTYKRMCICIMKNDHFCKYMGFSPTHDETLRRKSIMEKYSGLWEKNKEE